MPPRGKKISLEEFQTSFGGDQSSSRDIVNQRKITTEQVENLQYDDAPPSYARRPQIPDEPVPVPMDPPYKAYVRNLPRDFVEDDVAALFEEREIEDISIARGFDGSNRGFAFVIFRNREDLQHFAEEVHEIDIGHDHIIYVDVAKPSNRPEGRFGGRYGGGDRFGSRYGGGDRFADRGGDRFGGDRFGGDRGDRYGGDRYGGDRDQFEGEREDPGPSAADADDNWRRNATRPAPRGRGGSRGMRGDRFGGDRFGGDRFGGDRGGDRFGGDRFGGDRGDRGFGPRRGGRFGGDRYGDRNEDGFRRRLGGIEDSGPEEVSDAIYLSTSNPFGESAPVETRDAKNAPEAPNTEESN